MLLVQGIDFDSYDSVDELRQMIEEFADKSYEEEKKNAI